MAIHRSDEDMPYRTLIDAITEPPRRVGALATDERGRSLAVAIDGAWCVTTTGREVLRREGEGVEDREDFAAEWVREEMRAREREEEAPWR